MKIHIISHALRAYTLRGRVGASGRARIPGFILPMAMLLCSLVVLLSFGVTHMLYKEMVFSRLSRESVIAYVSADQALECALFLDDSIVDPATGLGIFPSGGAANIPEDTLVKYNDARALRGLPSITLDQVTCAQNSVLDLTHRAITPFSHMYNSVLESGYKTQFDMIIPAGDGFTRCARVTVNKTTMYRQIIAQGYSSCDAASPFRVERAVVHEVK